MLLDGEVEHDTVLDKLRVALALIDMEEADRLWLIVREGDLLDVELDVALSVREPEAVCV